MKIKFLAILAAATTALVGVSNAVTVSVIGVANDALGRASLEGSTAISGRAIFVSTTGTGVQTGAAAAFESILLNGGTSAQFDAALASLIGTTTANSPGIVETAVFTNGLIQVNVPREVGDVGNSGTLFVVAESGGSVQGIGAYSGPNVPPSGAMVFNPNTTGDLIGTSPTNGGFVLAAVVPEPSVALLGAIGVVGLLRRRR